MIHIHHQYHKVELNHTLGGGSHRMTEEGVIYNLYFCYTYGCECLSGEYYCADHEDVVHGVCRIRSMVLHANNVGIGSYYY